jgi:anthranilate synthase component I
VTYEEFASRALQEPMVQMRRELFADLLTPVSAYMLFRRQGTPSFLLETVEQHETLGRHSFVGLDPMLLITAHGTHLTISQGGRTQEREGDLFALLQEFSNRYRVPSAAEGFDGGFVGYIGYDAVQHLENVPVLERGHDDEPDAMLALFTTIIRFDHRFHRATLLHHVLIDRSRQLRDQYEEGMNRLEAMQLRLRTIPVPGQFTWLPPCVDASDAAGFMANVRRAKTYITDGEIFQVVLSRRLSAEFSGDPFAVYRALRMINPSPYLFYLDFDEIRLIGSSPESLVRVGNGVVDVLPIAGTRRRGDDEATDREQEISLRADEKENAEHLMLVDLGRNDVGRVSEYGSVEVPVFQRVDRYSHVMHLVSQVRGTLRGDCTAVDALRACFPAGTVSGAPKVRAMEIIAELEGIRRGAYAGAVGYLGLNGSLDTCIAIRTIVACRNRLKMQAGAGIVADSDPALELAETVTKMQVLLDAASLAAGGLVDTTGIEQPPNPPSQYSIIRSGPK